MKLFKTYIAVALAFFALLPTSCLKNQEDIFDEPSNVRMQQYLDNAKEVLMSAPNGWIFDYAPDRNHSYGMILYTLQFNSGEVTVGSAIAPGEFETSLYKLTNDNGPSLSFDSYNTLMHYFATPSWSHYQALDGDFEFIIMDVKPDRIILKGKRTGNFMALTRLEEDADTFIKKSIASADEQFLVRASGTVAGKSAQVFLNLDVNRFEVTFDDPSLEPAEAYFAFSPTGIRFPIPLEIDGKSVEGLDFKFDDQTESGEYTSVSGSSLDVKVATYIPADYAYITDYSGPFVMKMGGKNVDCTLEPNPAEGTVLIKGLNTRYDIVAQYSKGYGTISLTSQELGMNGNNLIKLCSGTGGGFYQAAGMAGVQFHRDAEDPNLFNAELVTSMSKSNEVGRYFVIIEFVGGVAYLCSSPWQISGMYEFELQSLTKK